MLQTKYMILIWIILLVIFTFYCVYRLSGMTPRPTELPKQLPTQLSVKQQINNFINVEDIKPQPTSDNIIKYIENVQKADSFQKTPGCELIYDDNVEVRSLGYNNCGTANADYFSRNLDINNKYGFTKSLAEMCPVSTKSDAYMACMENLLTKYNTNADIIDKVNNDMTNIINKRLNARSDILNDVEITINPYLFSKSQIEFKNKMTLGEPLNPNPDQILNNVNNYYETKYGFSKSILNNVPSPKAVEQFASNVEIYNIDPYIETLFFGSYSPIKGQYLAFNNLTVTLDYDIGQEIVNLSSETTKTTRKVLFTIIDNNTNAQISYRVINVDFYLQYKNVIKIDLFDQTINSSQPTDTQSLQQLLTTLGISTPGRLIMTVDEFTSSENITRRTYKLLNADMSTIMVLEKY